MKPMPQGMCAEHPEATCLIRVRFGTSQGIPMAAIVFEMNTMGSILNRQTRLLQMERT